MELTVLKNKLTGQVSISIPKSLAEMFGIDEKSRVTLEPKDKKKHEFILRVEK